MFSRDDRHDEAAGALLQAMELAPRYGHPLNGSGDAVSDGHAGDALPYFDRPCRLHPTTTKAAQPRRSIAESGDNGGAARGAAAPSGALAARASFAPERNAARAFLEHLPRQFRRNLFGVYSANLNRSQQEVTPCLSSLLLVGFLSFSYPPSISHRPTPIALGRVSDQQRCGASGVTITATNAATGFIGPSSPRPMAAPVRVVPIGTYDGLPIWPASVRLTTRTVEDFNVSTDRILNVTLKQER